MNINANPLLCLKTFLPTSCFARLCQIFGTLLLRIYTLASFDFSRKIRGISFAIPVFLVLFILGWSTAAQAVTGRVDVSAGVSSTQIDFPILSAYFWSKNGDVGGTWSTGTKTISVIQSGEDWFVTLTSGRFDLAAWRTYYVSLTCSSMNSPSYTIKINNDSYPWITYAARSVKCDGQPKTVDFMSRFPDQSAHIQLDFGVTTGDYVLSDTVSVIPGIQDQVPLTPSLAALRNFGFGQAVISPTNSTDRPRQDVAVVVGYLGAKIAKIDKEEILVAPSVHKNQAFGNAANIVYTIAPNAIRPLNPCKDPLDCNFTKAVYDTWLPPEMQIDTIADIGAVYVNDNIFSFLRLDTLETRNKTSALLKNMLAEVGSLNGFYIDLLDTSVAYPDQLTHQLIALKDAEVNAGRPEPVIGANFASLRQYLDEKNYDYFQLTSLKSPFDLVMTEDYGNPRLKWPDMSPDAIVAFHKISPETVIVVNVRFKMNTLKTYTTSNPEAIQDDTPCGPPFEAPSDWSVDTNHRRVREAVTVAALVGGLHAVDDGSQCHGENSYAREYLNFPNLRVGKPVKILENTGAYYRRDYAGMIAIYAKTAGSVDLPPGEWRNFWEDQGRGAILTGPLTLLANNSYLLFNYTGTLITRYRLYSDYTKEHLYTTDTNEYNVLAAGGGWLAEGAIYKLFQGAGSLAGVDAVQYYRLYNPLSYQHHWTTDLNEYNVLGTRGWSKEGVDGYILPSAASGSVPLYRLYLNAYGGLHLWTTDANEKNVLSTSNGWVYEGVAGYVVPLP